MSVLASDTVAAKITGVTYTPPGGSPQDHIDLQVDSYSITLDKARSPYVDATFVVVTPEVGAVALMDPTSLTLRCFVTLTKTGVSPAFSTKTRTFDLLVRSVKNDAETGTTTLGLSSDEALLVVDMYAASSVDTTYRANMASLRALVTAALAQYGFTLQYGLPVSNLVLNPSVASATTDWGVDLGSGTSTNTRQTSGGPSDGPGTFFRCAATATVSSFAVIRYSSGSSTVLACAPSKSYTSSVWVRSSVAASAQVGYGAYDVSNAQTSYQDGAATALPANTWVRLTVTATSGAGTTHAFTRVTIAGGMANGQTVDVSGWRFSLTQGTDDSSYFDGSTTASAYFTYAWAGTANASVSVATSKLDADYTLTSNVTNLIINPTIESATTGYSADTGTPTLTSDTGQAKYGTHSLKAVSTVSGTDVSIQCTAANSGSIVAVIGQTYTISWWMYCADARTAVRVDVVGPMTGTVAGPNVSVAANTWTRYSYTFTATIAATMSFFFHHAGGPSGTGKIVYVDGVMLTADNGLDADGATPHAYFDGSTGDTVHYAMAWTGTANASTSTRTRLDARDTKVLDRTPGSAMWDWLQGLVQAPGYRLFCDENRIWRLIDNTYTVAGSLALTQAINLTQGSDTIDIGQADSDGQGFVQKVQVIYQWIDRVTAANMTAYDFAGTGHGPGVKIQLNTPYPGPGYAAAVLTRMNGRAHVLSLKALTDLTATPGMGIVASLPSLNETGLVASVTWTDDDEMVVGTEGLVTIPANAWSLAVGVWSAATGTWAAATGTG